MTGCLSFTFYSAYLYACPNKSEKSVGILPIYIVLKDSNY